MIVKGFSILELIISMFIISVIASTIAPVLLERPKQARVFSAQQDVRSISLALDLYHLDNGFYPSVVQGLHALVVVPQLDPIPRLWNKYLPRLSNDPWGNPYKYQISHSGNYKVCSYGNDGIEGGTDYAADVCN